MEDGRFLFSNYISMYDAFAAYQEDKRFEEYLLIRQKIEASSSRIKDVLLQKLTTFFQTEKELTEVFQMVA